MNAFLLAQVWKIAAAAALILLFGTAPGLAAPSGEEILQRLKIDLQTQQTSLSGTLRTEGQSVPFTLTQQAGHSIYQFRDPAQTIDIIFSEHDVKINGVDDPQKPLRGSILSPGDLALHFLYWSDVQILGQEKIRSLPCWIIRLATADRTSPYAIVRLWVNQQSGAFLRADAYDWSGDRTRRFEVIATQGSLSGGFLLKEMRIQDLKGPDPKITYLQIDKPAK